MDNKVRRNATSVIWISAFIISLLFQNLYSFGMPPFAPAIGTATLATIFLWWNVIISSIFGNRSAQKPQPSKTSDIDSKAYKLAVLLEMMDEHERAEFKYQLKNEILSSDDSHFVESFISEKRKNR